MNHVVQPFAPQDLLDLQNLHEYVGVSPTVDRVLTQEKDTLGDDTLRRMVVRDGAQVLGYSYVARSTWHPQGQYQSEVFVHQNARRRGIGSALVQEAWMWARAQGATTLSTWANGAQPDFVQFAEHHDFKIVQRFVTMVLEVQSADDQMVQARLEAMRQKDISIFTFADTGMTQEARHKLYELNCRLAPYLPGNDDAFPSFKEYEMEIIEADWFRADGQLIAAHGDHWVGLVGLGFYDEGKRLHNEFTAVDPNYRRRGIALALKAWSVRLARTLGASEIHTGNDASNEAIISVNRLLGYRLEPGVVKLQRTVAE
jgi:GNAT superfamily N-acetyltransferase